MKYTKEANVKYSYSRPKKDITGMKFNQLEVIKWIGFKEVGTQGKRRSVYKCRCSCGNECDIEQTSITSGNTKSCGCRQQESKTAYKGEYYSTINVILNNYKQSARKHDREFSLTREQFSTLIAGNCHYCGDTPKQEKVPANTVDDIFFYTGIDRVNNLEGYTKQNTVSCCKKCNFLKKDMSQNEFLETIKKIYSCRIQ